MISYDPSEVAVLAIALVAGICVLGHRDWLLRQRFSKSAVVWFILQLMAWCCTVLEGFVYPPTFNFLEHLFYAAAAVFAVIACQDLFKYARKDQPS